MWNSFFDKRSNSYILAICTSLVVTLCYVGLHFLFLHTDHSWIYIALCLFIIVGSLVYLILENLSDQKLKEIYHIINEPNSYKIKKVNSDKQNLSDLHMEVEEWASKQQAEMEKLKANNKFKKEFLLNLSHELKTPIFTVQGYIETLLEGAIEKPEVATNFLRNASKGIERLAALASDLDEISKIEGGVMVINQKNFDIAKLIRDIFAELALSAKKKDIQLNIVDKTLSDTMVYADIDKMRQVIFNLIHNAIKYCNPNNEVNAVIIPKSKTTMTIKIEDNGPGIEKADVGRIFERFYRVDKSRSRHEGGTGLGLAIAKHIVEAHGKTIECTSVVNEGTTFSFDLPRPFK